MSVLDTRSLSVRRGHVGVLVVLCVFLTSGATAPEFADLVSRLGEEPVASEPSPPPGGDLAAAPVTVAESVAEVLLFANPSLSPRERARIGGAIERYSAVYDLDPDLVLAVMLVESNARPWAYSPKGAVGLMQVMPHMMEPMGLAGNLATIESNIEAGCFILANNISRLGVEDGISAYFWGSRIRGVAYLEKVLEARDRVRRLARS